MLLRKDDPIYYKNKIRDLLIQADENGLMIHVDALKDGIKLYFKAKNGDIAGLYLEENKTNSED